jgi:HlyD family secretion protein
MSLRRPWIWAVLALAVLLLATLAWRTRPPAVPAVVVQATPLVQTLLFTARVAAHSRVELGATVTARVLSVAVEEGATVRPGQVLVRLESDEWRAAESQALAAERAAEAALAQARSVLRQAEAEQRRAQGLVAQGFVSAARIDETERALSVARAGVSAAEAQRALSAAATQAARARLAQAELRAPAAGRVLQRQVEPGQIVQPGRVLLLLALDGGAELEAAVDERYLSQLRPGQVARVRADAFPQQPFEAELLRLAPQVDAQRGAVELRLRVATPPPFLREDMTLSVEVETGRRESALVLPLAALQRDEGAAGLVHRLAEGRIEARPVTLGLRNLKAVEVTAGLQAGDTVLVGTTPAPGAAARAASAPAVVAGSAETIDASTLSRGMGR